MATFNDLPNDGPRWRHAFRAFLVIFATSCILSTIAERASAEIGFDSRVPYLGVRKPQAVAIADLNHDGHLDVVSVSGDTLAVAVNLGDGNGTFGPRHLEYGFPAFDVAIGNIDGDANPDLIIPADYEVILLAGNGDGTFAYYDELYLTGQFNQYVAVGDFNGDNYSDMAVTRWNDPGVVNVILSNGDGTYAPPVPYATNPGPKKVVTADLNDDNKLDLVVANQGVSPTDQNTITVYLGNGDGTFANRQDFTTANGPLGAVVADLNGDTKPDIAVSTVYGQVSVLMGNGDGTFGSATTYTIHLNDVCGWITAGDLDGDGDLDLATVDEPSPPYLGYLSILENTGGGTFNAPIDSVAGYGPQCVAGGDLNEDGHFDLVTAGYLDYPGINVFLNSCTQCVPTAVEVALLSTEVEPGTVRLTWSIAEGQGTMVSVERKEPDGDWQVVAPPAFLDQTTYTFTDETVVDGRRYGYRLRIRGADETIVTPVQWVDAIGGGGAPSALALARVSPNPMSATASVSFALPADGLAVLEIYDVHGRLVRSLLDGPQSRGWKSLVWDGRDAKGTPVSSGVYFLRLAGGGRATTQRLVVSR